ncbi:DUF1611 domain-containing protein [Sphingobium algorifonticola]|uniref:DUF1611 domain-containing protein n=1 Tax=Sphingobium algorifonticola TaxID=2008318 RepID=A0A437J5P9_9SPHN|nr:DUF1611 domain-containing protein [Sphingobium algorifonticola]RVT40269.1 DUF1611 domain-containing protein [Sphingobium algorifonticola]
MTDSVHAADACAPLALPTPYLLFLGDVQHRGYAKTAFGLRDWAGELCIGEFSLPDATVSTGLPSLCLGEAYAQGARGFVIGVASQGGAIQPNWVPTLIAALEQGFDIVSGMHSNYRDIPELADAVARTGRRVIEVRRPPVGLPTGTGAKRTGRRLLTVGTDCALGKKYTALALTRAFRARGVDADFRATGQTGIMIAGSGIPIDAVVSDFVAGAAELLSPDAAADHWDVIEGQGSLYHPAYAGVSLGLLHGSQPDVIVLCHEPGRKTIIGTTDFPIPPLTEAIALNVTLGALTNSGIRCAGVSLNTGGLDDAEAAAAIAAAARETGLPAADPVRGGPDFERLVDACLA